MQKKLKILVVDDDESILQVMKFALKEAFDVTTSKDGQEAIDRLYNESFEIILLDIRMPKLNGIDALRRINKIAPGTDVVMLTATLDSDITTEAIKLGAVNYLTKPFDIEDLIDILTKIAKKRQLKEKGEKIQKQITESTRVGELAGQSNAIKLIRQLIEKISGESSTVLITGPAGVEHDVVASAVYQKSNNKESYHSINCANKAAGYLEEELFGKVHEDKDLNAVPSIGYLKTGVGGTLYLKNIDAMPKGLQQKFLKWLESSYKDKSSAACVRIIGSTSADLQKMVDNKAFDEELFHYLNEASIAIPSIRDRREDIPYLLKYYSDKYNRQFAKKCDLAPSVKEVFYNYSWPGNAVEMDNIFIRLFMGTEIVDIEQIPFNIIINTRTDQKIFKNSYQEVLNRHSSQLIKDIAGEYRGDINIMSAVLGVSDNKIKTILKPSQK